MRLLAIYRAVVTGVALVCVPAAPAQSAAGPTATQPATFGDPLALLQQALPQVNASLEATHPQKWKVKADEREEVERNYLSIHHDLEGVLPGLMQTSQGAPASVGSGLAVYRNVNALYDVLVRLQQTAALAGKDDAAALSDALGKLEAVRGAMADRLIAMAGAQEKAMADARRVVAAEAAAAPPKHIVADDAPVKKQAKKAAKPAAKPPAAKPPADPAQ